MFHKRSPGERGGTGASGSVWGGTCDGEGNPSQALHYTRYALRATQVDLTFVPFCRPCLATLSHFGSR
jgi:hypothetical protein